MYKYSISIRTCRYLRLIILARPKDGLFRLHASWIYLSYAGFDCLAAILCH